MMAYAGETPWHGLGTEVGADLTPAEFMGKADLDFEVGMVPTRFTNPVTKKTETNGKQALIRLDDGKFLDTVSDDWNPVQNAEVFQFFDDFVKAADMEMHTAGSLLDGKICWALAKIKDSYDIRKNDTIDRYALFTNYFKYGFSTTIAETDIRVVCNNTLQMALSSAASNIMKYSHRRKFVATEAKAVLTDAKAKSDTYKEAGKFLVTKKYTEETVSEFCARVFPIIGDNKRAKELSKNAKRAMELVETSPGHKFASGTWWNAFNAVTFMTNHELGRSNENRLNSLWYGPNKNLNIKALELATDYANAA